jgi:hypothetical protein
MFAGGDAIWSNWTTALCQLDRIVRSAVKLGKPNAGFSAPVLLAFSFSHCLLYRIARNRLWLCD